MFACRKNKLSGYTYFWLLKTLLPTFPKIWKLREGCNFLRTLYSWICRQQSLSRRWYPSGTVNMYGLHSISKIGTYWHLIILCNSVFTPYYSETVLYSMSELCVENEDGISILFYLQKIYPGIVMIPLLYYNILLSLKVLYFWTYFAPSLHIYI